MSINSSTEAGLTKAAVTRPTFDSMLPELENAANHINVLTHRADNSYKAITGEKMEEPIQTDTNPNSTAEQPVCLGLIPRLSDALHNLRIAIHDMEASINRLSGAVE